MGLRRGNEEAQATVATTLSQLATTLNEAGIAAPRGGAWGRSWVLSLLSQLAE